MTQASQALVYAMLVEGHAEARERRTRKVDRYTRHTTRTPILRRFAV